VLPCDERLNPFCWEILLRTWCKFLSYLFKVVFMYSMFLSVLNFCRSKLHDDKSSNFDDAKKPKWFIQDFKIKYQESNPRFKIQDSREEIKKQQVKTSYRISIKRIFQKPNSTVLFYKRIFSNFLSYQSDYSLVINYQLTVIDYQWPDWFSKCFQLICNVPKWFSNSVIDYTILVIDYKWI